MASFSGAQRGGPRSLLALPEPVHRRVELVLVGARPRARASVDAQGPRGRALSRGGAPAGRSSPAPGRAAGGGTVQEPGQTESRAAAKHRLDMPSGASARSERLPPAPPAARPKRARIASIAPGGSLETFAIVSCDPPSLAVRAPNQMRDVLAIPMAPMS